MNHFYDSSGVSVIINKIMPLSIEEEIKLKIIEPAAIFPNNPGNSQFQKLLPVAYHRFFLVLTVKRIIFFFLPNQISKCYIYYMYESTELRIILKFIL